MNEQVTMGHNNPPEPTEAEKIVERLIEGNADMIERFFVLSDAMSRLPEDCKDNETAQRITTFGNQLKACADTFEERRKLEKKPYDDMANAVHQFFKIKTDILSAHIGSVKLLLKRYLDAQAALVRQAENEARAKAEEEARVSSALAEKKLQDAANLQDAGMNKRAEVALAQAQEAENNAIAAQAAAIAQIKPASVNVRGTIGGMASSTGRVKAEVTDMAIVDLEFLRQYFDRDSVQKALNSYMKIALKQIKKDDPLPIVKGCNIFRDTSVNFRG